MSGTADGVPYTISFTVVDVDNGCEPLSGAAVHVWHCDREGNYSMYDQSADVNYLRGVQEVDANGGRVVHQYLPACYPGRWPHVHFEVYPSVDAATSGGDQLVTCTASRSPRTSATPCTRRTRTARSASSMERVSLDSDMVFSDGVASQTPSMTGNATNGYVSSLVVGVSGTI